MDFKNELKKFTDRISVLKDSIQTEEATKMSLIIPFFQLLGYDVFNPLEFCPEYNADIGIKKGEKVDYAILIENQPIILIEAKSVSKKLDRHSSQLFRYFVSTPAKFAILTNGITYKFYTDLDEANKMDRDPFLEIDLLSLKDADITQVYKFAKENLDVSDIMNTASLLKYNSIFKNYFSQQLNNPTDDFVKVFLQPVYKGAKTQAVIEKFRPILIKALNDCINESFSEKFQSVLDHSVTTTAENSNTEILTSDQWDILSVVKEMLKNTVDIKKISLKHTGSYTAVLYDNNVRKWICRLSLGSQKILILPDESKKELRFPISSISDVENFTEQLVVIAKRYIFPNSTDVSVKNILHTRWGNYEMPDPYSIKLTYGARTDLKKIEN